MSSAPLGSDLDPEDHAMPQDEVLYCSIAGWWDIFEDLLFLNLLSTSHYLTLRH